MRILFADSNHPILHETLTERGYDCHLRWDMPVSELLKMLPDYDGLVIRSRFRIDREVLDNARNLKCIGRVGAGMENIDVAYASSKNINCVCVPEGNRDAVGEHAIGMLLMLLNNLKRADAEVRQGIWKRVENRGLEIKDKTVGIIGYGQMGSSFAEKLSGFGCSVLAYDKYKSGFGTSNVLECSLERIFEECDIVSLHLPLTEETRYYANEKFFEKFRKNIFIINTARGQCLKTSALIKSLESGKVPGACLDVLEFESSSFERINSVNLPPELKYLFNCDKVILSPHIAGWTHESNYKMSKLIAEKMDKVLRSQK